MREVLRKAQPLVRPSVPLLEHEQPKEPPRALSSAGRSLMRVALRKVRRLVPRSVLSLEREQAKEQPRAPSSAAQRKRTKTNKRGGLILLTVSAEQRCRHPDTALSAARSAVVSFVGKNGGKFQRN
jgi:hypothetical protein